MKESIGIVRTVDKKCESDILTNFLHWFLGIMSK